MWILQGKIPTPKWVNNDELHANVTRCRDEVKNVRNCLGNIDKGQKELGEKIDK